MSILNFEKEIAEILSLLDPTQFQELEITIDRVARPSSIPDLEDAGYKFINDLCYMKQLEVEVVNDEGVAVVATVNIYFQILPFNNSKQESNEII